MAMPVRRWRRVPVKHEEIVRSGLYSCSLSLPVIFRRSAPSPMAEINFFIPVCLSKATQDWQGKRQILRLSGSNVHGARSGYWFIKIVAINHKLRRRNHCGFGRRWGIASENLSESPRPSIEAAPKGQLRRFCLFAQ